jgi:drug/metabolite transporter (DMT)-like permease
MSKVRRGPRALGLPRGRRARHKHEEDWDIEHVHPEAEGTHAVLIVMILLSVALAATAQIVLKAGMDQVVHRLHKKAFEFTGEGFRAVMVTPAVWFGLALFGLSALVWLSVLSRAALSFAYPFAALTYVVIVLYDFLRGEPTGSLRWSGVALIVAGIILVSRTSPHG